MRCTSRPTSWLRPWLLSLLLLPASLLAAAGCDPEPADPDAGPGDAGAPRDAGPTTDAGPSVGEVRPFAELGGSSEGIAMGLTASGEPALYVALNGDSNAIVHVLPDGSVEPFASLPGVVGIAARADGSLVACAKRDDSDGAAGVIYEVSTAGAVSLLIDSGPEGDFSLTNFIAVAPDGSLVFSDSAADRLFRADADGSNVALITDAISYPNGLAFSADGATLYVASWDTTDLYAFPFDRADGSYGAPEVYVSGVSGVDGVVLNEAGELLLVTSSSGVVRASGDGSTSTAVPGRLLTLPANGIFGVGPYGRWLYLTSLGLTRLTRAWLDETGPALPIP